MYEKRIKVPSRGFSTSQLFHELQELSGEAAAVWHASGSDLREIGLMWIVVRYDIQLQRILNPGETLMLQTWAQPVRHRMSQRNYLFYDEKDHCVLSGAGIWAVSDRASRTMVNPADYDLFFGTEVNGKELPKPGQPYKVPFTGSFLYQVSEPDLDINCHMNNTRYFDMAEGNAIRTTDQLCLKQARVAYVNEARLGERLDVSFGMCDNIWSFSGDGPRGNCFQMSLEYFTD